MEIVAIESFILPAELLIVVDPVVPGQEAEEERMTATPLKLIAVVRAGWVLVCVSALLGSGLHPADAVAEPGSCPPHGCAAQRGGNAPSTISSDNVAGLGTSWSLLTGDRVYGAPALAGGSLLVGSEDHHVYAVEAVSGSHQWAFRTDGPVWTTPAVVDGVAYFGSTDHSVYAVDAATGALRWQHTTGGDVVSSPAVADGVVYVGSNDHRVYALDAADGTVLWTFEAGDRVSSAPAVADGVVYVGSNDHQLYALDAATGAERWRFEADIWIWVGVAVADGRVFFTSQGTTGSPASNGSGGSLYAVDATSGQELWSAPFNGMSAPVVHGDAVIASSYTDVAAFDAATGVQRWTTPSGEQLASPVVANDVVLAVTTARDGEGTNGDGSLVALEAATGALLHEVYFPRLNNGYSSPVVGDTTVYFGWGRGVHAVSLGATPPVELHAEPVPQPPLQYSDHRDVLGNFLDPGSVAELRLPGDGVHAVSSSQDPKWHNGFDRSNSEGLTDDGREILLDVEGAGVLTNMMMYYGLAGLVTGGPGPPACDSSPVEAPDLAMYVDNNPEPVFDMNGAAFYCGEAGFPFVHPLTSIYGGLQWSHVPVPFRERLLIVGEDPFYYDYEYVKFPDARGVESFDPERDREEYEALIERWSSPGVNPHPSTEQTQVVQGNLALAPGEALNLLDVAGAGQVNEIRFQQFVAVPPVVTQPSSDPENDPRAAEPLRATRISGRWDNAADPQVDAAVDEFFGTGFGQAGNYDTLMAGMGTASGGLPPGWPEPSETSALGQPGGVTTYSFWPMPFAERAEIWLTNTLPAGGSTVEVAYSITYEPGGVVRDADERLWRDEPDGAELGYFHADAYYNFSPKDNSPKPERDVNDGFARLQGRGNYVGTVLNMRTHTFGEGAPQGEDMANLHYMEGDCMFWIDDAPDYLPDVFSTGHEECFDSGGPYFQYNVNNMTAGSTNRDACGAVFICTYTHEVSAFHWYTGDAIGFQNQFEATIEHGSENTYEGGDAATGHRAEHAGVSLYYLADSLPPGSACTDAAAPDEVRRIVDLDRIGTAIQLSGCFATASAVVLARSDLFPDALAASGLAAELDAPVLLTPSGALDGDVAAEIVRLGATTVYLMGGVAALSEQVAADVAALDVEVVRLGGLERFETAALIADHIVAVGGSVDDVIVALGARPDGLDAWPDAIAAGTLSRAARAPVILTAPDELPPVSAAAVERLLDDGATVYLAGGTDAVSNDVEVALGDYTVQRLAGPDRYATAVAIVTEAIAHGASAATVVLATGATFADALVAGPAAGTLDGVLLLAAPDDLTTSQATADFLLANADQVDLVLIAGGEATISRRVEDQVREMITDPPAT